MIDCNEADADEAADTRAYFKPHGTPIDANEISIAAQARRAGTLFGDGWKTRASSEFG